jgi:transcription termination factor 2
LSSVNYWALSGTPIHNKEADFYALLKFIKCHPFDDWAVSFYTFIFEKL